jgi:putative SOS response-associated peptidase YedK
MCGRFTLTAVPEEISRAFGVPFHVSGYTRRYNIAPSQTVAALLHSHDRPHFEQLFWGLIPFWAKDPAMGKRMINARSETLMEKKSFKTPFQKSRCLVVADGFYEWHKQGSNKIPYYIFLKPHRPFGFAGLWTTWRSSEGETITSCTLITTEANDKLKTIHDRMPVILKERDYIMWLDPNHQDAKALMRLLEPYDADKMDFYEVSAWVNSPGHEGKKCTERAVRL